jgi:hypothetical protein
MDKEALVDSTGGYRSIGCLDRAGSILTETHP